MFYVLTENLQQRTGLVEHLKASGAFPVFHYLSLHKSPYYSDKHRGAEMPESDRYMDTLLRLPLFVDMTNEESQLVIEAVNSFFRD
jgi:dTDP-4-amino-4,6-dideoxygalactose transaminase